VKAFIFERNGDPADVLAVRDLPNPTPGPGEVLVLARLFPSIRRTFTSCVDASAASRPFRQARASNASGSSKGSDRGRLAPPQARASSR
jgi:hypothetical protein